MRYRLALLLYAGLAVLAASEPVRVLHVPDYPPYEYLDEQGRPQGAFIELYRLWSRTTGRPVVFVCMPFSDELEALPAGRGDVITAMSWSAERARRFDFAPSILTERNHLVVLEQERTRRPAELEGRQVGVVAEEVVAAEVAALGAIPRPYPDYSALVDGLLAGEVAAATTSTEVLLHLLTRRDALGRVRVLEPPLLETGFRPAVRLGDEALLADLAEGFARIPAAEKRAVIERWLPSERNRAQVEARGRWLLWAGMGFLATLLAAGGLWLHNRLLRRRVSEATAALADSNRLLSGVLAAATEVSVIATDAQGVITVFNPGAERLTGRRAADLIGRETPLVLHDPDEVRTRGGDRSGFAVFVATAAREGHEVAEWTYVRPDGARRTVSLAITPMRDADGAITGWLGIGLDVTERRRMEGELRQRQRMEALGQLAGGVAHDFNNLLAGIMGYAELLALAAQGGQRDQAEAIVRGCERAAGLCRQLLAFSRQAQAARRPFDLAAVVRQTIDLFRHGCGPSLSVRCTCTATPATMLGDEHLVANALLNLLVNARDAMAGAGVIAVDLVRLPADGDGGAGLELAVADDGPGIPPEILPRIFEPFFTTKAHGAGTGLGLAAVYGIVHEHGGDVQVVNRPGGGARFAMRFPAADTGAVARAASPLPHGGGGRVLLVDDDDTVRAVLSAGLAAQGWEVRSAGDPASGRDAALAWRPDVLIVDQIMPGRHGHELLAELRAAGLACPAIILSGFVPEERLDLPALGVVATLVKPVRLGDLAAELARALPPDR